MQKLTGAIIQARMNSSRLPGKVLMDLDGKPALQRMIERVRQAQKVDKIIVATTTSVKDDPIIDLCKQMNCNYFRGSENDVLLRVLSAAKAFKIDTIVELTGDCPLIFWEHIDQLVDLHGKGTAIDITSNAINRYLPRGYDIRVVNTKTLEKVNREVDNDVDRQHVLTWMYQNPEGKKLYTALHWIPPENQHRTDIEVTLDTQEDYELINWLFKAGREYKLELTCEEVIELIDTYPDRYKKVAEIKRKDYFQELKEFYELKELGKDATKKSSDNRSRKTGRIE